MSILVSSSSGVTELRILKSKISIHNNSKYITLVVLRLSFYDHAILNKMYPMCHYNRFVPECTLVKYNYRLWRITYSIILISYNIFHIRMSGVSSLHDIIIVLRNIIYSQ